MGLLAVLAGKERKTRKILDLRPARKPLKQPGAVGIKAWTILDALRASRSKPSNLDPEPERPPRL